MGKGCGGGRGPGERGARAPQGGGRAPDAARGVRTRARRELAAAAQPVPPRLILGGVERPKRRRDRHRGGETSQLPVAKAQTEGSRGAARRREGREEEARPRGGAGPAARRPLTCSSRRSPGALALWPRAGSDPRRLAPGSPRRRRASFLVPALLPARPSPLDPPLPAGAHTAPLLGPLVLPTSPNPTLLTPSLSHSPPGLSLSPNPQLYLYPGLLTLASSNRSLASPAEFLPVSPSREDSQVDSDGGPGFPESQEGRLSRDPSKKRQHNRSARNFLSLNAGHFSADLWRAVCAGGGFQQVTVCPRPQELMSFQLSHRIYSMLLTFFPPVPYQMFPGTFFLPKIQYRKSTI